MTAGHEWNVKSSSSEKSYRIRGGNLADAIIRSFQAIMADIGAPRDGLPKAVSADYRRDILGGRGGVEVTIDWTQDIGPNPEIVRSIVWVYAPEDDFPANHHDFSVQELAHG
jgi:hypothetical protein